MSSAVVLAVLLLWGALAAAVGAIAAMTIPGAGGQTPARPDQQASPAIPVPVSPGSRAVVRARQVIVSGPTGAVVGVFVYAAGTTPGAGNEPIGSMTNQTTDPFGNTTEPGTTGYTTVGGVTYALQLGQADFGGSPTAGFFIHVIGGATPALNDPVFAGSGTSSGSNCVMGSGQSTVSATESGVQCFDSVAAGIPAGEVALIGGQTTVQGNLVVQGLSNLLTGHASVTAPSAAPSITSLGATWNATTASQANQNFTNIVNGLGALGLFT